MVRFNHDGFTIEVKTAGNPINEWLETHDQMIDLLQRQDSEQLTTNYYVLELLRSMMPDYETCRRMLP